MTNIFKGQRPDITPAQVIAAFFAAIYPLLTLFGVDLSAEQQDALSQLEVAAIGLFGADAAIRIGRNYAAGKQAAYDVDLPPDDLEDGPIPLEVYDQDELPAQAETVNGTVPDAGPGHPDGIGYSDSDFTPEGAAKPPEPDQA